MSESAGSYTIAIHREPGMDSRYTNGGRDILVTGSNRFDLFTAGGGSKILSDYDMDAALDQVSDAAGQWLSSPCPNTVSDNAGFTEVGRITDNVNGWTITAMVSFTNGSTSTLEIHAWMHQPGAWEGPPIIANGHIAAPHGEPGEAQQTDV